ncbi:ATP-binding cassette domain-containing protein [Halorarum salinum]|uniref:ATP-binding cassette domain-containing protein n=2 Tax=Halorarum salinum TaxID=2743089 RepID=A0A7D5LDG1_9EURY|nr:ATP-binding cassette domain-containing protein [Halobaculum salinum]
MFGGVSVDGEFPFVHRSSRRVRAVEDVSFDIKRGETLGLVGESGCGKSTLARTVLRLLEPTDGSVYFQGEDLAGLSGEPLRRKRKDMQMIFQDPQSSLDPRMKVGRIVEEPMKAHDMLDDEGREARAKELLEKVGLDPQHYNRHPHAFSGGQRQRINLARALSVNPDFIVCDEPVSALDVSIQAQVLNTMERLQEEFDLTYLFIAHDLSVIRHISDRVAVMYLGQMVELADKEELFENPQHPYTQALLDAIPVPDPRSGGRSAVLHGDVPSPLDPPSGCRFRTRCPELIQPSEYDMGEAEWRNVVAFSRGVRRREFETTSRAEIERRYFRDGEPDGEAGRIVSEAVGSITEGEWDRAERLLREEFAEKSVCAREEPAYEVPPVHGDDRHYAACHLNREAALATGDAAEATERVPGEAAGTGD